MANFPTFATFLAEVGPQITSHMMGIIPALLGAKIQGNLPDLVEL
jgi:hypothetical protein